MLGKSFSANTQGAITGWPSAVKYLTAILKKKDLPIEVRSLAPSQLEVVCYEYLRMNEILSFLLLPIGRTLPDIDIYGINANNENVMAQVTQSGNHREIEQKINCLKDHQSNTSKLIFFGPEVHKMSISGIEYVSVEDAFKEVHDRFPLLIPTMLGHKKDNN
jgi:hypothetical protein